MLMNVLYHGYVVINCYSHSGCGKLSYPLLSPMYEKADMRDCLSCDERTQCFSIT